MLNTKKLLYKICQRIGQTNTSISASNGLNGSLRLWKDNATGTVRGYGYFRGSTNIGINTTIFEIPSDYRPSVSWNVPMFLKTDTSSAAYYGVIATNGTLTQKLGSSIREGFVSFEYEI